MYPMDESEKSSSVPFMATFILFDKLLELGYQRNTKINTSKRCVPRK